MVLDLHEGGLERIVVDLVRSGEIRGEQSHVICVRRAGQLASELNPSQFTVLPRQHQSSMLAPVQLAGAMSRLNPQIVHLHSGIWFKGAYAARIAGLRHVVFTDHGRPHPDPFSHRVLDGLGACMSERVVAVSQPLAGYLVSRLRVRAAKLQVIPNGIVLPTPMRFEDRQVARRELGVPAEALIVGTVGRLDPVKAYDHLITAFAELVRTGSPRLSLVTLIVGDGPERARLERIAVNSGAAESIRFLGWRNDAGRLLGLLDLFVLPSDSEGTSLSLLEAMASGTAVVATSVGGTPDVIGDSGAGVLIPPRDHDALVSAIRTLLADPIRRASMGAKGRARVEQRYSFKAMADSYHNLYVELLDRE